MLHPGQQVLSASEGTDTRVSARCEEPGALRLRQKRACKFPSINSVICTQEGNPLKCENERG